MTDIPKDEPPPLDWDQEGPADQSVPGRLDEDVARYQPDKVDKIAEEEDEDKQRPERRE